MDFKTPWESISEYPPENGEAMTRQARKEFSFFHPLRWKTLTTLARRRDRDDVLFQLGDGPKVAVVHLTWSDRKASSGYPASEIFDDLSDFLTTKMEADHLDFGED